MHSHATHPRSILGALAAGLIAVTSWADPYAGSSGPLDGPGNPLPVDSFFDVFVEIDLPPLGGPFGGPLSGRIRPLGYPPIPLNGNFSGNSAPVGPGAIEIEIVTMTLVGGPLLIRESPTLPSLGLIPSGQPIGSFFDIFYELSFDGGQNWLPGDTPLRLTRVTEASSVAGLLALPLLLCGWLHRRRGAKALAPA